MKKYIRIQNEDNVAVALTPLAKGMSISSEEHPSFSVVLREDIPQGHKFTLTSIKAGEQVMKYGDSIGAALGDIPAGSWVHTFNLKTNLGDVLEYTYNPVASNLKPISPKTFMGYKREQGRVGIRNGIWIIPTNGCVNAICTTLANMSQELIHDSVEDIIAFPHPYGCSQMGEDQENTRKILASLITHPNAGGVLLVGLGCENSSIQVLKPYLGNYDKERVRFLQVQDVEDELVTGRELIEELISHASKAKREAISISELIVGTKCGGSDGLSGITANPIVGAFSDLLVAMGGSSILTEVPEMFGAETLLMSRCKTPELYAKTVTMINDFKNYFKSHNQTVYENPSPGNKDGGISTLEDKSLGCVQKSGTATISGVLDYGEKLSRKGLNLLNSPGNDLVAATALAASGCHLILFTTGRGTPFASPVPTVKLSSNSTLAHFKNNWIDFNCGGLVEGQTLTQLSEELLDFAIATASGKMCKSEEQGYHDFAIFKQGVTV